MRTRGAKTLSETEAMSYRKTVSLMPEAEMKLKATAKRRGVNANRAIEIAILLLDQVDHVRADSKVVGMVVLDQKNQQEQLKPMYFG
jgi:ribosomal protein L1